jgi:CRISPR system Cascade subunit CasC
MLIQIHMIQNYAPANLNRDDTGSPKDAFFGGYRRGRISSQCLKRSIRKSEAFKISFQENGLLGMRTRLLPDLIGQQLEALDVDEITKKAILGRIPEIGRESSKSRSKPETGEKDQADEISTEEQVAEASTKQLIFIGQNEIKPLAEKLLKLYQEADPKKWDKMKIGEITKALGNSLPLSVDIAMFGRMTTSDAFENVQAAVQVAHAISTNALTPEFDYYTAVDDLSGESGAGMIGDVEYNSSTFYKYLNIHWESLVENLSGDREIACRAVLALVEASATAHPSGKQNSFAAFNLPDVILIEVTDKNLPVSYANAFLQPVRAAGGKTVVDASAEKLSEHIERISRVYSLGCSRAYTCLGDYTFPNAEAQGSLAGLLRWLEGQLTES